VQGGASFCQKGKRSFRPEGDIADRPDYRRKMG